MNQQRINEIFGFIYLALGVLVLLSLMTYDAHDLGVFTSTPNEHLNNFIGIIGAYIAAFLFFIMGKTAYVIPFLCLLWAVARFTAEEPQKSYIKFAGATVLFLSSSSLLSLLFNNSNVDMMNAGGIAGIFISSFLYRYFGATGAFIIVTTLLLLSVLLATEFLIIPFVMAIWHKMNELVASNSKEKPQGASRAQKPAPRQQDRKENSKPTIAAAGFKKPDAEKARPAEKPQPMAEPAPLTIKIAKPSEKKPQEPKEKKAVAARPEPKEYGEYKLPTLDLLESPPPVEERQIKEDLEASSAVLEETLRDFGIDVKVAHVEKGPTITLYELEPSPGVKVNRITALSDDIALAMKAPTVRIIAPIPGKSRVGVECPNIAASMVYLREVLDTPEFQQAESKLTLALGKDTGGTPVMCDLAKMPHLLIAGTTGSGKTVCVNSIILSMLYNASPDELKFILIDPKMVEMTMFNKLPHLICPVVTDAKKVSASLNWVVSEMESRYKLFAKLGARNISMFNQKNKEGAFKDDPDVPDKMPYIVIIIDELADLMTVASEDIETAITRLAQLSRAVGIHMILATQRPSVDVITGVIKANFPARISFKVASKVDSRTVLDMNGADKLLGRGDMLFLEPGVAKPTRAQSSLVSDKEIEMVVSFISAQREPELEDDMFRQLDKKSYGKGGYDKDEYYDDAVRLVIESGQASVSILQRRMRLSHTRAARLIDSMESEGIVGPYRGSKPRDILIDREAYLKKEMIEPAEKTAQAVQEEAKDTVGETRA